MDTVIFAVTERVATITLNRPARLNAMNQQMRDELRACWQRVKDDPDIWVAIVTGAGRAFSSGADVEALATGGFVKPDRWRELAMHEGVALLPTPRRMRVQKPVIAAVNGVAAGVTLDLVTEADIPLASERAEFVDPHVSLGYVSSHEMVNMARRVPVAVCLRMALLGKHERMSARRAARRRARASRRAGSPTPCRSGGPIPLDSTSGSARPAVRPGGRSGDGGPASPSRDRGIRDTPRRARAGRRAQPTRRRSPRLARVTASRAAGRACRS